MDIKLIMWGEEGESMYGGSNKLKLELKLDPKNISKFYLESHEIRNAVSSNYSKKNYYWFTLDRNEMNVYKKLYNCHWSYFERWDENKHFKIARKYCGLVDANTKEENAINKHSHTDQKMFALHMYLAYLKYGFSRATSDSSIEIRHKRLTRKERRTLDRNLFVKYCQCIKKIKYSKKMKKGSEYPICITSVYKKRGLTPPKNIQKRCKRYR